MPEELAALPKKECLSVDSEPIVAILLATYNGEAYLSEQLASIEEQTYVSWMLIASDDGSCDRTRLILEDFARKHPHKVVIISRDQPTSGACGNFFFLMKSVAGYFPYYAFCDQDDVWECSKLTVSIRHMQELEAATPNVPALVFTDAKVVDSNLGPIHESFLAYTGSNPRQTALKNLIVQNPISGAGVLMNDLLVCLASRPESLNEIDMHDQWVALVAASFGSVSYLPMATYLYRQHSGNVTGASRMSLSTVAKKMRRADESLRTKEKQVGRFVEVYKDDICEEQRSLLAGYADIGSMRKINRIAFLARNGVAQNGLLRNLGLYVFI